MYRIGQSQDIHRLETNNRPLVIGGIKIPFEKGPVSHSDGDVCYHAISEALLGALNLGDLGMHFPDNDVTYKDMDSALILKECYRIVTSLGYELVNLDACVIIERPKLKDYLNDMKEKTAKILNVSPNLIYIKAQTNEKCGEIGRGEAMMATCSLLLRKKNYE